MKKKSPEEAQPLTDSWRDKEAEVLSGSRHLRATTKVHQQTGRASLGNWRSLG